MKNVLFGFLLLASFAGYAQNAELLYKEANDLYDKKEYQKALKKIDEALLIDSTKLDFYRVKTGSLHELKEYKQEFDLYNQLLKRFPKTSAIYNDRGNLLLNAGEFDAAIEDFSSALSLAENDTIKRHTITNRAAAKMSKRDFDGAYVDLLESYKMDSFDIAVLTNLGALCDEIGKGDQTLYYLLRAIEVDPKFYPAYGNIGFKYQEMGQYHKAIEYFNKVLDFDPNEGTAYSNLSYCKLKLKDIKGALSDIEKSISLTPSNSYAYRNRALIYIEQKKFDKACDDLQAAIDRGYVTTYGDDVVKLKKKHCEAFPNKS